MNFFKVTPTTTGFHIDVEPVALFWLKLLFFVGAALAAVGLIVFLLVPLISAKRQLSLINCLDCGGGVSPHAPACPHCGRATKS